MGQALSNSGRILTERVYGWLVPDALISKLSFQVDVLLPGPGWRSRVSIEATRAEAGLACTPAKLVFELAEEVERRSPPQPLKPATWRIAGGYGVVSEEVLAQ